MRSRDQLTTWFRVGGCGEGAGGKVARDRNEGMDGMQDWVSMWDWGLRLVCVAGDMRITEEATVKLVVVRKVGLPPAEGAGYVASKHAM